jgi:hypothetical protein
MGTWSSTSSNIVQVTWGGNNEVAIYTKGMKTKFFNRGFVAVPEEAN